MGDHFVLLMDCLITEATLGAAIERQNQAKIGFVEASSVDPETEFASRKSDGDQIAAGKLVECRICQDEDEDSSMETPCSCCGSLKYAHRKCVQRWCNEKGDTICEICLQQFKPGYTAPPKLFQCGRIPLNFRGNWEISRRDILNHRFITVVPTDPGSVGSSNYNDDYTTSSTKSIMLCRSIAIILMILLILRHVIPIIINRTDHYSLALFMILLLRTTGIVLPLYVILRAVTTFHGRRQQQVTSEVPIPSSAAESVELQSSQPMQTA